MIAMTVSADSFSSNPSSIRTVLSHPLGHKLLISLTFRMLVFVTLATKRFDLRAAIHYIRQHYVEFIPGPPAVGQDPIEGIHLVSFETGTIRIISPTDSVKDRLAAYFFWGDKQSLEQAILVARSTSVNLDSVKAWSTREGKETRYREFLRR